MQVLPLARIQVVVTTLLIERKQGQQIIKAIHSWLMGGSTRFPSSREAYVGADARLGWILFTSRFELDEFQFEIPFLNP